jgi:hypothetical protein
MARNKRIPLLLGLLGGSSAASPAVFYDTFTDANGVSLDAHTPNKGSPWVEISGNFDIQSNRANTVSKPGSPVFASAVVQTGISDCTVSAIFIPGTGNPVGIIVRQSDVNNFLCLVFSLTTLYILRVQAGGGTILASGAITASAGVGAALEVTLSGTSISVTFDGTVTLSTTSSFNQTATKHGIYSEEVGSSVDTLQVTL